MNKGWLAAPPLPEVTSRGCANSSWKGFWTLTDKYMAAGMCGNSPASKKRLDEMISTGPYNLHDFLFVRYSTLENICCSQSIFQARTFDCNVYAMVIKPNPVKSWLNVFNWLVRIINVQAAFTPAAHQPLWAGFCHTQRLTTNSWKFSMRALTDFGERLSAQSQHGRNADRLSIYRRGQRKVKKDGLTCS